MDKKQYYNTELNDIDSRKNYANNINKRNNLNINLFLNYPKLNYKRGSLGSIKSRYSSTIDIKNSNNEIYTLPKFVHEKVKEYKLHPDRRPNLKIVNEDIKYRLIEMNEKENSSEKDKNSDIEKIKRRTFLKKFDNYLENSELTHDKKLSSISNKSVKFSKIKKHIEKIENSNYHKNSSKINNSKREKKIKNNINKDLDISTKLAIIYRKLNRTKNLYDSMDDDESDKEKEDDYVINPQTNTICIFDFLIIVFFLYNFYVSTINLCREKCFCSSNNSITFSDLLLFFNDLLCISDLIISFFRGYYNFEYKLIKSNHLILINYLKYNFAIDFLSAIPIFTISKHICLRQRDNIYCFKYEMSGIFIFIKLCSVLKALKVKKIINNKENQAMEKFFELISDNYTIEKTVTILIYTFIYLGILHCFVCIHIFIGRNSYSNWLILTQSENESLFIIYIKSLYFIITTLTTIGYGDIICQSFIERIFQIIILAIGSIFYPYVISSIGNLTKKDSNAKIKHSNKLSMLEKIRKDYPNISFKLYSSIHKYLESKRSHFIKNDINSFIQSLPFTLKNNILFTMYSSSITNFKFFKNNHNSVFIAEVLNNFIPSVSRKNEFLIYEGEFVEQIIFIKDGKISFFAAINMEEPTKSIDKYFYDNFSPFTNDEDKNIIMENLNNKTMVSTIGDLTYDNAKNKLNNAFQTIKFENNHDEEINNLHLPSNIYKNEYNNFDIKGGAIINDEGNYQYLKIIDIRKNEHFGCVFMTLKKPCPLSLQVKSKIAELFLLKKEQALCLSKSYPNIWRKLYGKEFHNLRIIKKKTFNILKKYIEINELLINNNINDILNKNELTVADLNFLEKSALGEKSIRKFQPHSNKASSIKNEIPKNESLNFEYDKKNKMLNIDALRTTLNNKIKNNFNVRRNSTYTCKQNVLLPSKSFGQVNQKESNQNIDCSQNSLNGNNNNKINLEKNNDSSTKNYQKMKINEINHDKNKKIIKSEESRLRTLKNFLIQSKKYFLNNNNKQTDINSQVNKGNINLTSKKNCFKKKLVPGEDFNNKNIIKDSQVGNKKKVEFNLNSVKENNIYKFPNSELILNDLKDICEEETNFSFCSIKKEKYFNVEKLSIDGHINFEILSSYPNLNKISKGKFIKDINFQKKLKEKIKKYYLNKDKESNCKGALSLRTIPFSSVFEDNSKFVKIDNSKYNNDKEGSNIDKLNFSRIERFEKMARTEKDDWSNKYRIENRKKIISEKINKTCIKNEKRLTKNLLKDFNRVNHNKSKKKLEYFSTFKRRDFIISSEEKSSEIFDENSIRVNKSKVSSYYQKSSKENKNASFNSSIKRSINRFNNNEVEYIIDKEINKKFREKQKFSNNSFSNNNKSYKNKKNRYYNYKEPKYNKRNNQIINQMIGINMPNTNIITNNIITTSSHINENKDNFNTVEKIKNLETSFNIYNIIQKNLNKNISIIDNKENVSPRKSNKSFCCIF